jgi:hypothetical protein
MRTDGEIREISDAWHNNEFIQLELILDVLLDIRRYLRESADRRT